MLPCVLSVDGVLLGLQREEFHDFARIGSIRNVAKPILRHMIHVATGEAGKNTQVNTMHHAAHLHHVIWVEG